MREIKFRAWSKKHNQIWGVANLSWVMDSIYDEPERDIASTIQTVGATDGRTVSKVGNNPAKDIILMQYTGLKDKENKDIYEGDVLETGYFRRVVVYKAPSFYLAPDLEEEYDLDKLGDFSALFAYEKVIGNIYENPELLKEGE